MKKVIGLVVFLLVFALTTSSPVYAAGSTSKPNLAPYNYLTLTLTPIQLYMDEWGQGYLFDRYRGMWLPIPKPTYGNIQPSYCKTSDSMALIYGHGIIVVYDTNVGDWVFNTEAMKTGQAFASFSRTATKKHAAQLDNQLALAAGTNWITVYDHGMKRWINYRGTADDSTAMLDQNLQLGNGVAKVRVLNGPWVIYGAGQGSWREQR